MQIAGTGRWVALTSLVLVAALNVLMQPANAGLMREEVTVPVPKYQVPMSTIEGYAKAKLLRKLSRKQIIIDWKGLDFVSAAHKEVLQDRMFFFFIETFQLSGLSIKKRQKSDTVYRFQFEFEKPREKRIQIDQKRLVNVVSNLELAKQRQAFVPIIDIALSYPTLFPPGFAKKVWQRHFPYGSYSAVFEKKVKNAAAIKFMTKHIAPENMPQDMSDAMRLFDLAPFNSDLCWHNANLTETSFNAFKTSLVAHCTAINMALGLDAGAVIPDQVTRGLVASEYSVATPLQQQRRAEVMALRNQFHFDLIKRPALFALLSLPDSYDLNPRIFSVKNIGIDAHVRCQNGTVRFTQAFGDEQLTAKGLATFSAFLSQNGFNVLNKLLAQRINRLGMDAQTKTLNCMIDQSPVKPDNKNQLENNFGSF